MMTANGVQILSSRIRMPRRGIWTADVKVDTNKALVSPVTIRTTDGKFSLVGSVFRQAVFANYFTVRVVGGLGGLSKTIAGKDYRAVPVRLVLSDTLSSVGESLSSTSDATATGAVLPRWTRLSGQAGAALTALCDHLETGFRVQPDGSIWVGAETYPAANAPDYVVAEKSSSVRKLTLRCAQPFLLPGTLLSSPNGGTTTYKVSHVTHVIEPEHVEAVVYYEDS